MPPPRQLSLTASNEAKPTREMRMLKVPLTPAEFDHNKQIMKGFFDEHLVHLLPEDIANLGRKLIDCEYVKLLSDSSITLGRICPQKLISDLFDRWIRKMGWDADLCQIRCILVEMGNKLMCDNMDFYIRRRSQVLVL